MAAAILLTFLSLVLLATGCSQPEPPPPGPLRLYFLNVGQGDGALIITPEGLTALVDGGDNSRGAGLVAWLHSMGIQRVDWVMPSHPHTDHIGGLNAVLQQLTVGASLMSAQEYPTATFRRHKALIAEKRVPLTPATEGTVLHLGAQVTATVLNPPAALLATKEPDEDNSVVLRVCLPPTCILFTGDIGDEGERALAARYQEKADQMRSQVLKVSHHGSAEPNYRSLLEMIKPEVALIGAGAGNPHGHPTRRALDKLKATGATIYCTLTDGTVLVEITEEGYTVTRRPDVVIQDSRGGAAPPDASLAGTCAG